MHIQSGRESWSSGEQWRSEAPATVLRAGGGNPVEIKGPKGILHAAGSCHRLSIEICTSWCLEEGKKWSWVFRKSHTGFSYLGCSQKAANGKALSSVRCSASSTVCVASPRFDDNLGHKLLLTAIGVWGASCPRLWVRVDATHPMVDRDILLQLVLTGGAVCVPVAGWGSGTDSSVPTQKEKHWLAKEPCFCLYLKPCISHAAMASVALQKPVVCQQSNQSLVHSSLTL